MISESIKVEIDAMPYEAMLRRWRFAPVGDPIFKGEVGAYYSKVMGEKRVAAGPGAHVTASKTIGWEA